MATLLENQPIFPSQFTGGPGEAAASTEASMSPVSWQAVAERVQNDRASAIPAKWVIPPAKLDAAQRSTTRVIDLLPSLLSHHELQITALGASALAAKIRGGGYSCLQVAEAFLHQAAVAHQLTNCLTEIFFAEALEQARQLDHVLQTTGKPVGPLHGVPVSVKDHFNVKGQRTTASYICFAALPVKDNDAHIVEILRNAGAVLYAKTNNPQCMMALETVSNIYGRTLNPWNTKLGAGGSSGGEGALLAQHGSPLGVGSDIGGSVRVPAAFNGLYAFRPSANRVPMFGLECTMVGFESIMAVAGPMGHNVEDLELFFQIVSDAKPWLTEPLMAMPWRSQIDSMQSEKLRIGIMVWDEVVMPHPYITRVIKDVAAKLKEAGHDVFDFEPYDHRRAWEEITLPSYFTDDALNMKKALAAGNEPMLPSAKRLIEDPIVRELSIEETWKLNIARDIYRFDYLQKWAKTASQSASGKPMDVLICPVSSVNSTPHDVKPWWGYGSQWNLLDYPAGVLPAGKVLESDAYPDGYQSANELDKENMELYDNSMYLGMPVAIQVVGPRHEDEKVMGAMSIIDKVIHA
ncbi:amidase [Hirsutella rhossiliensis]|uniref:amidase n=1 Tax=Hirsutella rhossiliensis TaxID=111463 RepID=A0A9P8N227_9HYPO|nr:amidase domain-containing protein [Hirsutella rhossiliensis]KAH0965460.1 amidase domain-containing protein [Hirsutella rhossiliensis]